MIKGCVSMEENLKKRQIEIEGGREVERGKEVEIDR